MGRRERHSPRRSEGRAMIAALLRMLLTLRFPFPQLCTEDDIP